MAMNPRLLRPRASGFNPKSIANLGLWLDATDTSSLTFNGNNVSEWRDLSGNGRHYAQADAALQPSATRTQNAKRVVDFNGSTTGMAGNAAANDIARNVSGFTIVMAAKSDDTSPTGAGGRFMWFASRSDSNTSARLMFGTFNLFSPANGFGVGGRRLDSDAFASVASSSDTNAHIFGGLVDYSSTTARLFVDGTNTASNTSFHTAGSTPNTASLQTSLGGVISATQHLFDGFIGEVIVYQRALSAAERQTVERYLGRKWGITVA